MEESRDRWRKSVPKSTWTLVELLARRQGSSTDSVLAEAMGALLYVEAMVPPAEVAAFLESLRSEMRLQRAAEAN